MNPRNHGFIETETRSPQQVKRDKRHSIIKKLMAEGHTRAFAVAQAKKVK